MKQVTTGILLGKYSIQIFVTNSLRFDVHGIFTVYTWKKLKAQKKSAIYQNTSCPITITNVF